MDPFWQVLAVRDKLISILFSFQCIRLCLHLKFRYDKSMNNFLSMNVLHQHARRLAFDANYTYQNTDHIRSKLDLFKEMDQFFVEQLKEQYRPMEPVGFYLQPLFHALMKEGSLKLSWLKYFTEHPSKHPVFEEFEGQNVGDLMLKRLLKKSSMDEKDVASFQWWISSNPNLDQEKAKQWLDQLGRYIPQQSSYSSKPNEGHQLLIKALNDKGVEIQGADPYHPPERWNTQSVFLDKIDQEQRWDDPVASPSGQLRTRKEFLNLTADLAFNRRHPEFESSYHTNSKAPHGRKKELVDQYVLGIDDQKPVQIRVKALLEATKASDGAWEEFYLRVLAPSARFPKEKTQLALDVLNWKDEYGLSIMGRLKIGKSKDFHYSELLLEKLDDDPFVNDKGEGLLVQYLNHHTQSFKQDLYFSPPENNDLPLEKWIGDEAIQTKLVNQLVDMMVAVKPSKEARRVSQFIQDQNLLKNHPTLAHKLHQAHVFSFLGETLQEAKRMLDAKNSSHFNRRYQPDFSQVDRKLDLICKMVENEEWVIHLTTQDWSQLKSMWNFDKSHISMRSSWKEKLTELEKTLDRLTQKTELTLNQPSEFQGQRRSLRL